MKWTEEAVMTLRAEWTLGTSTAAIAEKLHTTKSAVVGKAHRMDPPPTPTRLSPIRQRDIGAPYKPPRPPAINKPSKQPKPLPTTEPQEEESGDLIEPESNIIQQEPVTVFKKVRRFNSCCWPIGEPRTNSFKFCDDLTIGYGKPYCLEHCKVAYLRWNAGRKEDPDHGSVA